MTFASAHLDIVESELVVMGADHSSMVHRDETVEEVWRVLNKHAGVKWNR